MLTRTDITNFIATHNYDLRQSKNARWIDQKCASDVISVIADCILNYLIDQNDENATFTTKQVWHHHYSASIIEGIFKKPGVRSSAAKNEYDKFFQQPMEMFANAGVLEKIKISGRNYYCIQNKKVLEYISISEKNALFFLQSYIEKVLRDSGIWRSFDSFFQHQDKDSYGVMKRTFSSFIIRNTPINKKLECDRIFIKVLNPLAFARNSYGTERGRLSTDIIRYDMLMYNRENFRDVFADKPKGVTRKEYLSSHPVVYNEAYFRYQSAKAKRFLRDFNDAFRGGISEYPQDVHSNDPAINIHHIFPEADYPSICYFYENLIALTPTQHFTYAHPNGRTQEISRDFQRLLLLAKADRISENLTATDQENIYEFSKFLFVLSVGFDNDDINEIEDMNFASVVNSINVFYGNLNI